MSRETENGLPPFLLAIALGTENGLPLNFLKNGYSLETENDHLPFLLAIANKKGGGPLPVPLD